MAGNYHAFSSQTPGIPKTIMLVEDDAEIAQDLIRTIKEKTRHYVFLVNDAKKAIDIARSLPPDLFLFDTHLPGGDGQELPQRLHTTRGLEHVPALMINTRHQSAKEIPATMSMNIENVDTILRNIQELLA